jgi:hypothetical protein
MLTFFLSLGVDPKAEVYWDHCILLCSIYTPQIFSLMADNNSKCIITDFKINVQMNWTFWGLGLHKNL